MKRFLSLSCIISFIFLAGCGGNDNNSRATPSVASEHDLDIRETEPEDGMIRLYGHTGRGDKGVPVAGGSDMNGDGFVDFAMASMLASPEGRSGAGEVYLALGNGEINYTLDSGLDNTNLLTIIGDGALEMTGSEIWMDDVTGDGVAELLIARQNFNTDTEVGVGALSIIIGSSALTTLAANNEVVDLRDPPASINVLTITGENELDRLGIWMRTGDITGDGILDIAVGADQHDAQGSNSGVVYVVRGGAYLETSNTIALDEIAGSMLDGQTAKLLPPNNSTNFHLGATVNIADLDGNGSAELLAAATINRAGAGEDAFGAAPGSAIANSGSPLGRAYIVWDDNFPDIWPTNFSITIEGGNIGAITDIQGANTAAFNSDKLGEELLGGLDYDGDGSADIFIGDITGSPSGRSRAGLGYIFFNAAQLKGLDFNVGEIPAGITFTVLYGTMSGAISSDTALHGDFDNDGIDDLAVSSPHDSALGRPDAGTLHVLWGQSAWPSEIDLASSQQPAYEDFAITNIFGANGTVEDDLGDILAYSAAAGDIDNDGFTDLIVNEMVGNGSQPNSEDVGNLIAISGALLHFLK
ncbi:MAG: hypothetical protein K6L76_09810 [Agarilytica sp.]